MASFHGSLDEILLAVVRNTSAGFCYKVLKSSLHRSGTEGHLHFQRVVAAPVKVEPAYDATSGHLRKVAVNREFPPEAVVRGGDALLVAVFLDGLRESYSEISVTFACPTLGDTVAGEKIVAMHADACPEGLALVIVDAVRKVRDQVAGPGAASIDGLGGGFRSAASIDSRGGGSRSAFLGGRESVAVMCRAGGGCDFRPDAVIGESDCVVARGGRFAVMAEAAPVAVLRMRGSARV